MILNYLDVKKIYKVVINNFIKFVYKILKYVQIVGEIYDVEINIKNYNM